MALWRFHASEYEARLLGVGEWLVGTGQQCDLRLADRTVSRQHARLRVDRRSVLIEDLGSKNGTWLGEERIARHSSDQSLAVSFGGVQCTLTQLETADGETGLHFTSADASGSSEMLREQASAPGAASETAAHSPHLDWASRALPRILQRCADLSEPEAAVLLGRHLVRLPGLAALRVESGEGAVLFDSSSTDRSTELLELDCGDLQLVLHCTQSQSVSVLSALVAASFAGLSRSQVGTANPTRAEAPALPEPATLHRPLQEIYEQAARAARAELNSMILGATGTGKEVLARYLHEASARTARPFVAINCASLPKDLLEAELFGVERGVATGVSARAGCFERAHGGTLFLDEIGEMPADTQAMILRVLQERQVVRVGGARQVPADVWVLSATNRDLTEARLEGGFREDLWYRLAAWTPELPTLAERHVDIAGLASWFAGRESRRRGYRVRGLSRGAIETLRRYGWPGNVRQLRQEMHRAVAFTDPGALIDTRCLSQEVVNGATDRPSDLPTRLEAIERREIRRALSQSGGSVPEAASLLGLTRSTLYRRIQRLGIELGAARSEGHSRARDPSKNLKA